MSKRHPPRSSFFAGLSHRVRQPLGAVHGAARSLAAAKLSPAQRSLAGLVACQTHDLVTLVNDIQDLVRMQDGNFHLSREPFDLHDLAAGLQVELTENHACEQVACEVLLHPHAPARLLGDAGRLRRMLAALAEWQLPEARPAKLQLAAAVERETDREVVLRFSAHAALSTSTAARRREMVAAAAEPRQAEALLREAPSPEAVRLVLAARLAESFGGGIGAQATGAGLDVWASAAFARASAAAARAVGDPSALDGRRVLIVENDPRHAESLARRLAQWGCKVGVGPTIPRALSLLRRAAASPWPYGLALFVNHNRPQEAEDFGRFVRRDAALSSVGLVLLSEAGRRGDAARLREIGFAAYLVEPVTPQELREALILAADVGSGGALITRHSLREARRARVVVWIAEEEAGRRAALTRLVESLGCEARPFTGADAAGVAAGDAVLADADLAVALRREWPDRRIAILGVLTPEQTARSEAYRAAGVAPLLSEPLEPRALRAAIDALVREAGPELPLAETSRDWRELLERFGQDADAARALLRSLAAQFKADLGEVRRAIADGKPKLAAKAAEKMRDAAGAAELASLRGVLADAAAAAAAGSLAAADALATRAERALARLLAEADSSLRSE
jgi:DNA-binding response OmpR family regulator